MKHKILSGVSLLFGLVFINAGLNKFLNYMPVPEDLPENLVRVTKAFMEITWLMPLVGAAELAGGLLFAIPKTRVLGALVIFPVMVGIVLTHIVNAPSGLPVALVLLAVNLWVLYENRARYLPILKGLS